jgi:hypothetical protein
VVRRVVEEDVATPTTTVYENDGSWIGRTIVALVILALLVAGAVWLVRALSDNNDNGVDIKPNVNITQNDDTSGGSGDTGNVQPSGALPS